MKPALPIARRPLFRAATASLLVVAVLVGLLGRPATATAQTTPTPIALTEKYVHDKYFIAKHMNSAKGYELVKSLVLETALHGARAKNPEMNVFQTVTELKKIEKALDERKSSWAKRADNAVDFMDAALGSLAESEAGPAAAWMRFAAKKLFLEEGLDRLDVHKRAWLAMARGEDAFGKDGVMDRAAKIVQTSLDSKDPVLREARDIVVGVVTGSKLGDDTREIIDGDPLLQVLEGVNGLIDKNGEINANVTLLRAEFEKQMTQINGQIGLVRERLINLDKGQQEILKWIANEQARRVEEERIKAEAARAQLVLDAKKAGVYLLSTFIGFADPKLGRQVAGVGNAAIQIAESLNQWSVAASKFQKAGDRIGEALTGAVMTGNIVGAIMSLVPLFIDTGPTMDQIILDEIRSLQKQVSGLQQEMNGRFDRIDAALNAIWTTLDTEFAKVNRSLGEIKAGIGDLQAALANLDARVDRFSRNVFELITDKEGRVFWQEADEALGYEHRSGGATMPYQPDYLAHESFFFTWATRNSFDSLATMPSARSYEDEDVLGELDWPLEKNINYLAGFAARWNLPFTTARLPSAVQWGLGARGYATLALEWPQHAARVSTDRIRQIEDVGVALQNALKRISTSTDASGAPKPNRPLFARLFANYREKLQRLDAALKRLEDAHLADMRAVGIDIFAGPFQPVQTSPLASVGPCDWNEDADLSAPNNVTVAGMFPAPVLVAQRVGVGGADLCARTRWVDEARAPNGSTTARLRIEIGSSYLPKNATEAKPIRTYTLTLAREVICDIFGDTCKTAAQEAASRWRLDGLKAEFEADATVSEDASLPSEVAASVEADLRRRQSELYARLAQSFTGDQTGGNADVRRTAVSLSGAKRLLEAFITLGFPRALERDEFLHAFLHGSQRVLDEHPDGRYSGELIEASSKPPATNARVATAELAEQRLKALEGLVNHYLGLIEQGAYEESNPMITATLDRLAFTRWVIREEAAAPAPNPGVEPPVVPPVVTPVVDPAPVPDTRIVSGPSRRTTSRKATFRFAATEAPSTFQCKLDRRPWRGCASPKTYRTLKRGTHTFRVRAVDGDGNVDPTPATLMWRIR